MTAETCRIMVAALSVHMFHVLAAGYVQACLYKSSSRVRTNRVKFNISNIDFTLCTHYVYGYAIVDPRLRNIVPADPTAEEGLTGLYSEFNKPKEMYPLIKTILSIGGLSVATDLALRNLAEMETPPFMTFSQNAVTFLREKNFDGLDVDWQYPLGDVSHETYNKLLQALRTEFDKEAPTTQLLLTATVLGIPYEVVQAYDVPTMAKYVDYVFVKSFDLIFNKTLATFSAPLFHKPNSTLHPDLNVNASIRTWNNLGMPYNKIVVGVTTLGPYVRLVATGFSHPGAPATSEVLTGHLYNIPYRLAYPEVCLKLQMKTFVSSYDFTQESAYLTYYDQWIGHETVKSMEAKITFITEMEAAGIFYSALDEDDFNGTVCNEGRYPVLSYIKAKMQSGLTTTPTTDTTNATTNATQTASGRPRRTTMPYVTEDDGYTVFFFRRISLNTLTIGLLIVIFIVGYTLGYIVHSFVRKKIRRASEEEE